MKCFSVLALAALLTPSPPPAPPPAPPPGYANVVVPAGTSVLFTQPNATFSLSGVGTLSANGVYTAPPHIDAPHPVNGIATLPADHVYFTPVTNLPIAPPSATWLQQLHNAQFAAVGVSLTPAFHVNQVNNASPTYPISFLYTGLGAPMDFNGVYSFPSAPPWVGIPGEYIQGGIYANPANPGDRHVLSVNTETGIASDVYNAHPTDAANHDAISGAYYGLASPWPYNIGMGSVASGHLIGSLMMTAHEIRTNSIHHPSPFTLPNGLIAGGANCPCYIWPATSRAYLGGGFLPYGAVLRLRSTVDTTTNPQTNLPYSAAAQAIFTAWKTYGIVLTDGGMDGQIEVDTDIMEDPTLGYALVAEVSQGTTSTDGLKVGAYAHWDVVDESSLEISALSGQVNPSNTFYHPAFATVNATDNTTHATTSYPVILQPITVGVPNGIETIQSGQSLWMQATVHGSPNSITHWNMNPVVGTLTDAGLFTPPPVKAPTQTVMTVTADADPLASTTILVTVVPSGGIYMRVGPQGLPYKNVPFTDSQGNVWQPFFTGRVPWYPGISEYLQWGTGANGPGSQWPASTVDWQRWQWLHTGEQEYRIKVANGTYTVTLYMGIGGPTRTLAPHVYEMSTECQGVTQNPDFDWSVAGNGLQGQPLTQTMTCNVTNGELDFGIHGPYPIPSGPVGQPGLNAFSVVYSGPPTAVNGLWVIPAGATFHAR